MLKNRQLYKEPTPKMQALRKNFGLTEAQFDQMNATLKQGDNRLFEQTFLAHFQDCMNYLKRNYNASHEDAYDISMDALLEFCRRLKAGKITYGNLRFLFTQMAGQMYLKWVKKQKVVGELAEIEIEATPPEEVDEEAMNALNQAWEQLGSNCKRMLRSFYYDQVALKKIAEDLGKSDVAIRKQKQRCMEKLRNLFKQYYLKDEATLK